MKRLIDYHLLEWKVRENRKPLLLRGARQVGKTYAIRNLGKSFTNFVEINLDFNKDAKSIIERDMDPHRIVRQLSELLQVKITPQKTLLFFDEIQNTPQAIIALRYFYELMPNLHIAAAGSLLDFAIEKVGIPVGRVSSLFMYPLSFLEFLVASGNKGWAKTIIEHDINKPIGNEIHEKIIQQVGEYLAIGGMPEAITKWIKTKTSRSSKIVHSDLIYNYQQDFGKYAKKHQIKYLDILFEKANKQLSNKFMFNRIGEYQKRELEPALRLLEMAGLFHRIMESSGQGIPLGAQARPEKFKLIFLDVGLSQSLLKLDIVPWIIKPLQTFVNKGEIVEAFVGQELLAYSDPIRKESLFYWKREKKGSSAEIDYLVQIKEKVIPIEVKAGSSKRIKSMQIFLESHPNSIESIRFSTDNYSSYQHLNSYPIYAVAKSFLDTSEILRESLISLTS